MFTRKYIGRTRNNGQEELIGVTGDAYMSGFHWLNLLNGLVVVENFLMTSEFDIVTGPRAEFDGFSVAADYLEEYGLDGAARLLREAVKKDCLT